ncbi:MAG: large conductance mechanosensitive channel protein MscL [Paracoccus sp. (in: a-proteobacteria)]|nr:large conductance mechanosensitive channel protein MscL [Paracoccus sp. (in: a-proteobacteria)]
MIKEFKDFIARGNVMDMAVGIIIGAAFTAIVTSMVDDLINPIIGLITGGTDFSSQYLVLSGNVPEGAGLQAARDAGAAVFAYGAFLTAVINFLIIAFVVFLLVKGVNRVKEAAIREEKVEEEVAGPTSEELLAQIRDELRIRNGAAPIAPAPGSTI